jgi:tetratricopeptide (TPR) repeat protein
MTKKSKRLKQRKDRLIPSRLVEQWISQAHQQMYQGDFASAITTCKSLLDLLSIRTAQRVEVLALLGLAHGMLQHFPQSYDAFTEALTLEPPNAELWYNHALACRYMTRLGQAVRDLEHAIELLGPDDGELARKFAQELQFTREQAQKTMKLLGEDFTLDQLIELEEDFQHGLSMMKSSKWKEAEQAFRRVIERSERVPQYWGNLGVSLVMQLRYDEAEDIFKHALEIDPEYPLARNNLAKLPAIRQASGPPAMETRDLSHEKNFKQSITFHKNSDGSSPGITTTIEKVGDNISRIRTPVGKQPPRYRFFLNPYQNTRFTTCPRCGYKTRPRKFSLFIHIDPDQPLLLDKLCRYCYHCNLIIAHQNQLEDQMATTFSTVSPEIIGNTYEVLGTIDRSEWKRGLQDQLLVEELIEHLHDFNEVVTYKRVGV